MEDRYSAADDLHGEPKQVTETKNKNSSFFFFLILNFDLVFGCH